MSRKSWTKKDERKYEAILESCKLERKRGRTVMDCKRIAAATVNRGRRGLRGRGLGAIDPVQAREYLDALRAAGEEEMSAGARLWELAREGTEKVRGDALVCRMRSVDFSDIANWWGATLQAYAKGEALRAITGGQNGYVTYQVRQEMVRAMGELGRLCHACSPSGDP